MNTQAKLSAVARLRKAMDIEKITKTSEAAGYLGLNPIYVSMIFNEKHWPKCSAHAFERLILWCNSGSTLKGFKAPEPVYKGKEKKESLKEFKERLAQKIAQQPPPIEKITEPIIRVKPEALQARKKELENRETNSIIPKYELKEDFNPVKSGEYVDPVELLVEIAKRLPANIKIVITINNE